MIFGDQRQGLLREQAATESRELHEAVKKLRQLAKDHSHAGHLHEREHRLLDNISKRLSLYDYRESRRFCPECLGKMSVLQAGTVDVDCCRRCHSIWLDRGELKQITGLPVDVPGDRLRHRPSKRSCPVCAAVMTEYQFCHGANLLVDSCPASHGVYLQQGELERALLASHTEQINVHPHETRS